MIKHAHAVKKKPPLIFYEDLMLEIVKSHVIFVICDYNDDMTFLVMK